MAKTKTQMAIHPRLRPELNGELFKLRGINPGIHIILDGQRCLIPNMRTYSLLFKDDVDPIINPDLLGIEQGPTVSIEACLVKGRAQKEIYFVNNSQKRLVAGKKLMKKYNFSGEQVREVPRHVIEALPAGEPLV